MSRGLSSAAANGVLAIVIGAAIAVALIVTSPQRRAATGDREPATVHLRLPPAPSEAERPVLAARVAEPFSPGDLPPPPTVEIARAPARAGGPQGEQFASLTPPQRSPAAAPPLKTVAIEDHAVHAVPKHEAPARRVVVVRKETAATAPPPAASADRGVAPRHREVAKAEIGTNTDTDSDDPGVRLAGPAIVTGPLELNIAGKPLRLYGVKAPSGGDMCAPDREYAARACADVSRQVLAARIGRNGEVSCRILAVGGRSALPVTCKDATGTDLATYLVEHGFALAEANDMVDYSAAETRAKSDRSGLWSYR